MPINPESKRYFESMEEKIRSNPITFNEFAIYCKYLKLAIANRILDYPFHYAFMLYHANILETANKDLYNMYREELMGILVSNFFGDIENQEDALNEFYDKFFDDVEKEIKTKTITYNQFRDYCEKLQFANDLHANVDLISCAMALKEADIELPEKSTELIRFNKYYSTLVEYINENKKAR